MVAIARRRDESEGRESKEKKRKNRQACLRRSIGRDVMVMYALGLTINTTVPEKKIIDFWYFDESKIF